MILLVTLHTPYFTVLVLLLGRREKIVWLNKVQGYIIASLANTIMVTQFRKRRRSLVLNVKNAETILRLRDIYSNQAIAFYLNFFIRVILDKIFH